MLYVSGPLRNLTSLPTTVMVINTPPQAQAEITPQMNNLLSTTVWRGMSLHRARSLSRPTTLVTQQCSGPYGIMTSYGRKSLCKIHVSRGFALGPRTFPGRGVYWGVSS